MHPYDVPEPQALATEPTPEIPPIPAPVPSAHGVDAERSAFTEAADLEGTLPPASRVQVPEADDDLDLLIARRRRADRNVMLGLFGGAAAVLLLGGALAVVPRLPAAAGHAASAVAHYATATLGDRLGWSDGVQVATEDASLASALGGAANGGAAGSGIVEASAAVPAAAVPAAAAAAATGDSPLNGSWLPTVRDTLAIGAGDTPVADAGWVPQPEAGEKLAKPEPVKRPPRDYDKVRVIKPTPPPPTRTERARGDRVVTPASEPQSPWGRTD